MLMKVKLNEIFQRVRKGERYEKGERARKISFEKIFQNYLHTKSIYGANKYLVRKLAK